MQGGLYVGHRVKRELAGKAVKHPFRYRDLGSAAYISRGNAVISVGRLRMSGFFGWLAWLFIHIAFLTGYRNRFGAILTWALAFSRETRRERAFITPVIDSAVDVYAPVSPAPNAPAEQSHPA
jgi:NADH dehydrogenase